MQVQVTKYFNLSPTQVSNIKRNAEKSKKKGQKVEIWIEKGNPILITWINGNGFQRK